MPKKGSIAYAFGKIKKLRPRKTGHSTGEKKQSRSKDGFDYESNSSDKYRKHLQSMGL